MKAIKAQCLLCSVKEFEIDEVTNEFHGEWTKSTKTLPKQFSFINIKNHAKKKFKKGDYHRKDITEGIQVFLRKLYFDVFGKCSIYSEGKEYHVKCKCY